MRKNSWHTRYASLVLILALLVALVLPGCGKPANTGSTVPSGTTSTGSTTVAPINYESVFQKFCADMKTQDSTFQTDGLLLYTNGVYYVSIGDTLYPVNAAEAAPLQFENAGDVLPAAVAEFRGIPYITYLSDGTQTARACNYYLEVSVADKVYTVSFYASSSGEHITLYNENNIQITRGIIGQIISSVPAEKTVKNVIFMIADGGGYDNFTLADKVKQTMVSKGINKLNGAKTEVTTNLLSGLGSATTNGLYLNQFLVGSANTLLQVPHSDADLQTSYITDSAAAGTALATGYKTAYGYLGLNADKVPVASLSELARLNGMATGVVTNKSYMDATPQAFFTSHSIVRYEYQDNSLQSLFSGVDVVIGEGTEFGDLYQLKTSSHPEISAYTMGYTVARSKTELLNQAGNSATKKLWAPILGADNSLNVLKTKNKDYTTDHITFDVDAALSDEQPSLLDMTKAALQVLSTNINDPDGFFLMVEGGALDNVAEGGCLRSVVGEYLAFDEVFGYCVDWASQRGDTIVIAVPDHDSGGFSGIESCEAALIDCIITGELDTYPLKSTNGFARYKTALGKQGYDTSAMQFHGEHTDMAVPICLYAPESIRTDLLKNLTLPTEAGTIRTGTNQYYVPNESGNLTWYASSALNNDYTIDNTKIAPAIAKTMGMGSLDNATSLLFTPVGHTDGTTFTGTYGGSITTPETVYKNDYAQFSYNVYENGGLSVTRDAVTYTLNGQQKEIAKISNAVPKAIFVLDERNQNTKGTFYVPPTVLTDAGLAWSITISCDSWKIDKVLCGSRDASLTLPEAPEGTQIIYTDGTNVYHPGDTIAYTDGNLALTAYVK